MSQVGVVVGNLGTPNSASAGDVAKYLREFLMDPYVIDMPWLPRWLLVNGIIAPFRSKKSAANYEKVWMKEGSPLLVYSESLVQKIQEALGEEYKVVLAMRYGEPSMAQAAESLKDCQKVIFFPQYPQYAESTYRTAIEQFDQFFSKDSSYVVPPYWQDPRFLGSYKKLLGHRLDSIEWDHLLMSFHGVPESHLIKADPVGGHCANYETCCDQSEKVIERCYRAQCFGTARGIAKALGVDKERYSVSFQSRLGPKKWTPPYTESMYQELVDRGVRRLAVICPAFSVDCLETLEEIAMGGKESFLEAGGEEFHLLPCLNDDSSWVQACKEIILEIT